MSHEHRRLNAVLAYTHAVDALTAARQRNREIRDDCFFYEPPEKADPSDRYPGSDGSAACPWSERQRGSWCATCATADLPNMKVLRAAKRSAARAILAAGRALAIQEGA